MGFGFFILGENMKRFIVLFLFASSVLLAQDIHVQTVTVGADTGRSSAYTAGYYGFTNVQATPVAFCTPASLETDSLYKIGRAHV